MRTAKRSPWLDRAGWLAVALVLGGLALAWLRFLAAMPAFEAFALGGLLSIPLALAFLVSRLRGRALGAAGVATILVAALFAGRLLTLPDVPSINDFTTDSANPPAFTHARTLPANLGREMSYPAEFAVLQQECCADLGPLRSPLAPAAAYSRAMAAASGMQGWEITSAVAPAGPIEAVAVTDVFGFRDDIVIRIQPDGAGSVIDIRSKSRDGRSDIGANADRIRAWQDAFQSE